MAEREMRVESVAKTGLRAMSPLQYIADGTAAMFRKLAKEAELHASWDSAGAVRVPHAVKVLLDNDQEANFITVSLAGPECYKVSMVDGAGGLSEGVVNWAEKTCSRCLKWQDQQLPCSDAIAVGRIKGLTAVAVFEHGASNCYKVQKPALEACTAKYVPLPPPAYFEAIKLGGDVATTDAAFLNASDDTAGADPSGIVPAGLPAGGVLPPDNKAVKGHGNAKANRYKPKSDSGYRGRGGGGRKTRARTREAATLTAALRTSRLAQLHCSTCTKAGRIGPEYDGHKAPQCPYDTAAVQARASVTIVLSSSSDDGDVAFTADLSHETGVAGLPPPAGGRKHTSRGASGVAANASYARKVAFAAAPLSLSDSDDDDDAPLGALLGGGGRGGQRQALRRGRSAGRGRAYPAARVVTRVYDTEDDEAGTSSAPAPKKRRHTKLHKPAGAGP